MLVLKISEEKKGSISASQNFIVYNEENQGPLSCFVGVRVGVAVGVGVGVPISCSNFAFETTFE